MTDIVIASGLTPAKIAEMDAAILVAEQEGDAQALAQLVPQHYAYYAGSERFAILMQALDDWRIVHFRLFREAGYAHAFPYFVAERHSSPTTARAASTRMLNAITLEFFYREQEQPIDWLFRAGIEKLRNHKTFASKMAEEEGELHPYFLSAMEDMDIGIGRVTRSYKERRWPKDPDELAEPDSEERPPPALIYCDSEGEDVRLNRRMMPMYVFDEEGVSRTIGYISLDSEDLDVWERHIAGQVGMTIR